MQSDYDDWSDTCTFKVQLIAKYNTDIVERRTWKAEGKVSGGIKVVDVEAGGGYETSTEKPRTVVHVYAEYIVKLNARANKLQVTGHIK